MTTTGSVPAAGASAGAGAVFDARLLKAQFPIFSTPREKPLVYLDSAATSQKPQAVLDAMDQYYGTCNANIHRGVYAIAEQATALYEDARRRFASFVNASPRLRAQVNVENVLDSHDYLYANGNNNITPGSPRGVRLALTTQF